MRHHRLYPQHHEIPTERRSTLMKTIETFCEQELSYPFPYPKEEILFFDIETTGFSPKTSALYLIGVLFFTEGRWKCVQWFGDDYSSETSILSAFFSFLQHFKYLIHFNGSTFDVPFVQKKCMQHGLSGEIYTFSNIESLDLYKEIFPHRKRIHISNLKQKSLEEFLHIKREDIYTGKELIKFYQNYLKAAQNHDQNQAQELEYFLLLHNREDLVGMLEFSSLMHLVDLLNGTTNFSSLAVEQQGTIVTFQSRLPFHFPVPYQWKGSTSFLSIDGNTLKLILSAYAMELKYFYSNYKDYFYLPTEDTAIHKSVASYVDKEFRKKATKDTCYIKQSGFFLPAYSSELYPLFQESLLAKERFLLLNQDFFSDGDLQLLYIRSFFKHCPDLCLEKIAETSNT